MKRNGNAERWRCENRGAEGVGSGQGVSCAPSPEIFLIFLSGNGALWCILSACFNVSIRRVKQRRKAVLYANYCQLVNYLTWRTYHPWYHTHKHILDLYQSQQSASHSNTHAGYTMDIVDIHVHATVYLCILLSCIYFNRFNSFSLKLLSADGMFIFMNTLVAYGP